MVFPEFSISPSGSYFHLMIRSLYNRYVAALTKRLRTPELRNRNLSEGGFQFCTHVWYYFQDLTEMEMSQIRGEVVSLINYYASMEDKIKDLTTLLHLLNKSTPHQLEQNHWTIFKPNPSSKYENPILSGIMDILNNGRSLMMMNHTVLVIRYDSYHQYIITAV